MSWGKASSGVYDYYGSIAGAVCVGPVTHLLGVVCDGKLVWPGYDLWTEGEQYGVGAIVAHGGRIYQCIAAHTATKENAPLSNYWQVFFVWLGDKPNPYKITVPGYGSLYLYRGTLDQQADPFGVLYNYGHPPYRGICVVELIHWYLGRMREAAPNIELIVRRTPNQSILPAELGYEDRRGQINPLTALLELLTNPFSGAGLPVAKIDVSSWQSTAYELKNRPEECYVSPIMETASTVKGFIAELVKYYDGWFRTTSDGKIKAGRFPHGESLPTGLVTITYNDLTEEIDLDAKAMASTANEIVVRFSDSARSWNDASQKAIDRANWTITGAPRTQTIDLHWINWEAQAATMASELLKRLCWPGASGTVKVRAQKAASIEPGDLFLLEADITGTVVARCIKKTWADPDRMQVELEWESDTTHPYAQYKEPPKLPAGTAAPEPEVTETSQVRPWIVPACLTGKPMQLGVLAFRRQYDTIGFRAWLKSAEVTYYSPVGQQTAYAMKGTITQDHGVWSQAVATATRSRTNNVARINCSPNMHGLVENQTVDVRGLGGTGYNKDKVAVHWISVWEFEYPSEGPDEGTTSDTGGVVTKNPYEDWSEGIRIAPAAETLTSDWDRMAADLTSDDVNDNRLICVVFSASSPSQFEVMSVRRAWKDGDGNYRLRVKRSIDGRAPMYLHQGDEAWMFWRSQMVPFSHEMIEELKGGGEIAVKMQAVSTFGQADLVDITPVTFEPQDPWQPQIAWWSAQKRSAGTTTWEDIDWGTVYATSTTFRFTLKATALDNYLAELKLVGCIGDDEITLVSVRERVSEKLLVAQWTLPSNGEWGIIAVATDESGRTVRSEATFGGQVRRLKIGDAATVLTPVFSVPGGAYMSFPKTLGITCSTPDAMIYYQIVAIGAPPNSANWQEYTGPVNVYAGKTVHAYAAKDGMNDSAVVSANYWLDESGRARPPGTEEP